MQTLIHRRSPSSLPFPAKRREKTGLRRRYGLRNMIGISLETRWMRPMNRESLWRRFKVTRCRERRFCGQRLNSGLNVL